ncbi:MAG: transglycosylase SLT domain-containing protein [Betaproteobacteria bacterium]|nr:transglycosylase SLT domain-containing protein [Betaproteobacteria bacterium]
MACLALSGPARATGAAPALKISYSLATLSEAQGLEYSQADIWERIRAGFNLPESDPRLTRVHEQWYGKNPRHLERAIQRSRLYLFHIVEEVEKRGMPMEIALLPMIESAFNPQALSPMKASGIWQFIPSTGRIYGLEQNAWYDGRRDVLKATHAALDYLQTLHRMFGDWELALAAYNCGEGCVARALGRGHGKAYAGLRLPNETRNYVPKLVAVRNVIQDPGRFGVSLHPIADEAYFMQVTLDHPMTAQKAAKLAEMNLDEFLALNPAFQRRVIYADSQSTLLLPVDRVEAFQFNASRQEEHKRLQTYQARRGESVGSIAQRFGVSLDWMKEHNPIKLHGSKLASAQTLVVPSAGKPESRLASAESTPSRAQQARTPAKPLMRTHTVRKGDTLSRVARHYNVKVADIRRWNENAEPLMPGSTLEIPAQPS